MSTLIPYILVFFLVCIPLFGLIIYTSSINHKKKIYIAIQLENHTKLNQNITIFYKDGKRELVLSPENKIQINIPNNSYLTTKYRNYDGNDVKFTSTPITVLKNPNIIYLTYQGIYFENSSPLGVVRNVKLRNFINGSSFPIILVQYSADDRRWPTLIGMDSSINILLVRGTKCEIVHPSTENIPLTTFYVKSDSDNILFNGNDVKEF